MNVLNLEFIKKRRLERNLTLKQMADKLGISNASVYWKYESGVYTFKAEMLPLLSKTLKCSISKFFCIQ